MENNLLLNVSELAKILKVQPNTIRVWLSKSRVIPERLLVRLGRRVLFNHQLTVAWIADGCKPEENNEKSRNEKKKGVKNNV